MPITHQELSNALPWETMSRRRSDLSMRRDSTGSRRNSLLSESLFDFPVTPGGHLDKPTFAYSEADPFAPISLSEPLTMPLPLTPVASRTQTIIDRLLGDRSESSGDSGPTVVSAASYDLPYQQYHNDFQPLLAFSNASTLHAHFNFHNSNPIDHFQLHKPISPMQNPNCKMTLESVPSAVPLASPVQSKSNVARLGDDHDDDDDDDDDDSNQNRFKPFHEEKWSLRYKELLAFHKKHGHAAVPHTYPANPQLARWVKRQRRQFKVSRFLSHSIRRTNNDSMGWNLSPLICHLCRFSCLATQGGQPPVDHDSRAPGSSDGGWIHLGFSRCQLERKARVADRLWQRPWTLQRTFELQRQEARHLDKVPEETI
jgi:Helicase associated domain